MSELIQRMFSERSQLQRRLVNTQAAEIEKAAGTLIEALNQRKKILLFGNGGSAADAQHIAAELVGRFLKDRRPLSAIALTTDTSVLTSIGNDYGFDQIFSRQVEALGQAGDVAIAISTSGDSPNVLAGVRAALARGMTVIGLTGKNGGHLLQLADIAIVVPVSVTAHIQEAHIIIGHIWCELVDAALTDEFAKNITASQSKILTWDTLDTLRSGWKRQNQVVVWTNGCFDLLHVGHIRTLQLARQFGDVLVVGLNSDVSVNRIKGPTRPIVPEQDRAEVLAALTCVDYIIIFDENTPEAALMRLRPDIHCKGMDYAPPNGKPVPEAALIESYGGRVAFIPLIQNISTTDLIKRIQENSGG